MQAAFIAATLTVCCVSPAQSFSDGGAVDEESGVHGDWEEGENEDIDEREDDLSDTAEGIEDHCGESYYYFVADLVQETQGRGLVQRVKPKVRGAQGNAAAAVPLQAFGWCLPGFSGRF